MPINVACPRCGANLVVDEQFAGSRVKCGACDEVLSVPSPEALAEAEARLRPPKRPRPKRTTLLLCSGAVVVALVATLLLVSPAGPFPRWGGSNERDRLIWALVTMGDEASAKDRREGQWAYDFALFYAPKDEGIAARLKSIGGRHFSASNAEIDQVSNAVRQVLLQDFRSWPQPTPEMDLVELRMLLDQRLVGALRYTRSPEIPSTRIFVSRPTLTVGEVQNAFGTPSEEKSRQGRSILTYGRIRLYAADTGSVQGVFFHETPSATP